MAHIDRANFQTNAGKNLKCGKLDLACILHLIGFQVWMDNIVLHDWDHIVEHHIRKAAKLQCIGKFNLT